MKDKFGNRAVSILGIIIGLSFILLVRLLYVQVIAVEYKQFAEENTRSSSSIVPSRGLILDRNGKRLVSNETAYNLIVVLNQMTPFDTAVFCDIFDIEREFLEEKLQLFRDQKRYYTPTVLLKQLPASSVGRFQERQFDFRGFYLKSGIARRFEFPIAAHILGYLAEVTQKDIKASEGYYRLQDQIGKSGLEKEYEGLLRGEKGYKYSIVDKFNRTIGKYSDGDFDVPAESGKTLLSTIDAELQQYGERLMQNKLGAIVAIEPSTGEVLAMVSSPSFDPTEIVGRKRSETFALLSADTNKPMYNRAITARYPPGSTFKPFMALIGLQEGVITPSTRFPCRMGYTIPGLHVGCHQHKNNLDLLESVAQSCNAYYCHTFRNVIDQSKYKNTQEGFEAWYDYIQSFGMGVKLGIDLPNEKEGDLPTVSKYDRIYGAGRWRSSYIISLAIGQAEISLTPLQMANMTAVMANRGYYYTPHLVKEPVVKTLEKKWSLVEPKYFEPIIEGMAKVFETGTARWYAVDAFTQCGKTGTAENPHGEDHSNFIAFAPREEPKIAIAVVIENGGFGATWAAPIASLMIEKYLTDTITRPHFEKKMLEKDFIHKEPQDSTAAGVINHEE